MWWVMVVVVLLSGAGAGERAGESAGGGRGEDEEPWLRSVGRDIQEDVADLLRAMLVVQYADYTPRSKYKSRIQFSPGRLKRLYDIGPRFIDKITDEQPFHEGFLKVVNKTVKITPPVKTHRKPLMKHYKGTVNILKYFLVLMIILPILGGLFAVLFVFLRNKELLSGPLGIIIKLVLSLLLLTLLGFALIGVVYAYWNEMLMVKGLNAIPLVINNAIDDICTFIDDACIESQFHLTKGYQQITGRIFPILLTIDKIMGNAVFRSISRSAAARARRGSRAAAVAALHRYLHELEAVRADLHAMRELSLTLQLNADHLNTGLRKIKGELLQTLATCQQPQCAQLHRSKLGQLDTELSYSNIPDVSSLLNNVTDLLNTNVTTEVAVGQHLLRQLKLEMKAQVERALPSLKNIVTSTGKKLEKASSLMRKDADKAIADFRKLRVLATKYEVARRDYEPLRRGLSLGAPLVVVVITALLVVGLIMAWIAKSIGAWVFMGALVVVSLLGVFVAAVAGGFFVAGVGSDRLACDPTGEPSLTNRMWDVIEKVVDIEKTIYNKSVDPEFTLARTLERCHRNMTMYNVLDLHRVMDLEKIRTQVRSEILKAIKQHVGREGQESAEPEQTGNDRDADVRLMSPGAKLQLRQLADLGDTLFDFEGVSQALESNVSQLSLSKLAAQLAAAADSMRQLRRPQPEQTALRLRHAALQLRRLDRDAVAALATHARRLNATALRVRTWFHENCTLHRGALFRLLEDCDQSERYLRQSVGGIAAGVGAGVAAGVASGVGEVKKGANAVLDSAKALGKKVLNGLLNSFVDMMVGYLNRMVHKAGNEIARCEPISNVYNVSRLSFCQNILLPHHGSWLSLAWCSAFLLPALLLAGALLLLFAISEQDGDGAGFSFSMPSFSMSWPSWPSFSMSWPSFSMAWLTFGLGRLFSRRGRRSKDKDAGAYFGDYCGGGGGVSCACPAQPVVMRMSVLRSPRCACPAPAARPAPPAPPALPAAPRPRPPRPHLVPR